MRPLRDTDRIGCEGAEGDKFSPFHSAAQRNEPWVFATINFASADPPPVRVRARWDEETYLTEKRGISA